MNEHYEAQDFSNFRSAVYSQLKVAHRWSGLESDLELMNLDAVEALTRFAWLTGQCPFCSGSVIAEMAGLPPAKKYHTGACH